MKVLKVVTLLLALMVLVPGAVEVAAAPPESERLGRAKDFIADERWLRAIAELRIAVDDRKETARDEAAFWLAHSLYQAGEPVEALAVIERLEAAQPRSRWVKPARSLRIEIAHRLQRKELLWRVAAPPKPPAAPPPGALPGPDAPPPPRAAPPPGDGAPRVRQAPKIRRPSVEVQVSAPVAVSGVAELAVIWDPDLRLQALSSLMSTEAPRVVPILREIALEEEDEAQARRAIYVLAQSDRQDARSTIAEIARKGDEPRQVTAIKMLAYQGWPEAEKVLLDIYGASTPHVKRQVIRVFGSSGARTQLRRLFDTTKDMELKHAIINALFEAGARGELERIAQHDEEGEARRAARSKLELLKTVK